ncbi:unnamed protein product [Cladocopium goreaui]|uniref:D-2-hydroxyglutarate dehydrogenase, mitochondrial n=1 Tax=Cladocopium goreaui TaxID=2562237 RepID=A0A9P1GAW4_9DINO|nr:unnamed protein product [Cladocopium goreaui]
MCIYMLWQHPLSQDLFAGGPEPLQASEAGDPLEGLTPLDRLRVKRAWREMQRLPWIRQGRLPSAVYSWLSSRGIHCNAGELALAMLQRQRDHERHLEVHPEKNPEVPPAVLLSAKVLLLRAAAHNDLCILEAKEAARLKAEAEALEAAKRRAQAFQKWCQRKASVQAAAAANALLMAFQGREVSQARKRPLWMRFCFSGSTEAVVSVLPSAFKRRMLEPQEARYGISVWGYVHLEWPSDKEDVFSHQDAEAGELRSTSIWVYSSTMGALGRLAFLPVLPAIFRIEISVTPRLHQAARVIVEKYYGKLTLDFQVNKKITEEVATIPSKRLRNKIAGFTTHLMKRIGKGPVRGISLKLQEEERERRMEFVPDRSEVNTDFIQVDPDTREMLKEMEMDRLPNISTSNTTLSGFAMGRESMPGMSQVRMMGSEWLRRLFKWRVRILWDPLGAVSHVDLAVEPPTSKEGPQDLMSLPSLDGSPPQPSEAKVCTSLDWWEDHFGLTVTFTDPKEAFQLQVGSPVFMARQHLESVSSLPEQEDSVTGMLPSFLLHEAKEEQKRALWNHAVQADPRLTGTMGFEDPMITQLEDAIRASAWPSRTWVLAGVFFAALAESLGRSGFSAEEAARRAMLLGICAKLMAKQGRRRDAHARELDLMEVESEGPENASIEEVAPMVSFKNFHTDISEQPPSPTSTATQVLREALARDPVDLEELSMALEHARRADVDVVLLQRGEEIFMNIIEKQGAVTRLATAIQNRMLKELRAAVQKAEEVQLQPSEYPDSAGCGILQRARDVVKEEELAALEELSSAMKSGGAPRGSFATLKPDDLQKLKQILGPQNVMTPEEVEREDLLRYNQDWMGKWEGRSAAVLKPATTKEVSEILAYANGQNLAVVPQGGNTGLVGGSVPVHDELVLSLLRMNHIEALDTVSGIVTVQAGCVLEQLDQYLAQHGFMVPLDLGAKGTCTIGGNAATNAGGLRYLRYGSLRGNILGVEAVLADGQVVDSLSALRKDNTGYGLPQLFIGSEGTLGVITKLTILCPPRPKAVNIAFFACSSFEHVQRTFALARQKLGEVLSAVEFCDRMAIDFVLLGGALRTVGVREALTQAFTLLGQGDVDMFMLCDNPCEPDDMSLP